jgi:hypothetical protein
MSTQLCSHIIIIIMSIVPSGTQVVYKSYPSFSVPGDNLRSLQLCFPLSLSVVRCHEFLGLPLPLVPCGFHCKAALHGSLSSLRSVCPSQPNLRFVISLLMFIWPVTSHSFSLDITLGHQILMIYRKHLFTKDWSFLWISHVTSQVWHPYSSTDLPYTLNSFIFVSLFMYCAGHMFLSLVKAPLAFWILISTSLHVPPFFTCT